MFEPARPRCWLKIDVRGIGRQIPLAPILAMTMTMLCACAASHGSASKTPLSAAEPEGHIYVASGGLEETCYQDLGQIVLTEPYAQFVVASADSQAEQVRDLARKDYGSQVEAVINVREHQNDAGTSVDITGDAVQLRNHTTPACAARVMPEVLDSASATAAGGIVGTIIGGLSQSGGSVYGAEAGGAIGASAAAGNEIAKRRQKQQAQEAFIGDRLEQQRKEIADLYQQLTNLIGQQCNNEELTEQDCEQRITKIQQQLPQTATAQSSESSSKEGNTAGAEPISEFGIINRVQEQQEIIDQLQQRIAQIRQSGGDQ
jgi:hypothetical protein